MLLLHDLDHTIILDFILKFKTRYHNSHITKIDLKSAFLYDVKGNAFLRLNIYGCGFRKFIGSHNTTRTGMAFRVYSVRD